MLMQQLSIFIEHKPGRLAEITEVLAEAKADVRAVSVVDTSDFGILRVVVDKPQEAVTALKAHGMTVTTTNVMGVAIDDTTSSFAKVMRLLSAKGFDLEYMYTSVSREDGKAFAVIRVDQCRQAAEALQAEGWEILA